MKRSMPRILMVASGGGHWVQMMRVLPAFEGCDVSFVTTEPGYRPAVGGRRFHVVMDANRWRPFRLAWMMIQVALVVLRERPTVVFSTGAAPGYIAIRVARWLGARTIWLDSIANAKELSMSGRKVGPYADLWLTQWPELAHPQGPAYKGAVV